MSITPALVYDDAPKAIDWLMTAFGFTEEVRVLGPAGQVFYAELRLGADFVMIETAPDGDLKLVGQSRLPGRSHGVCVQVADVQAHLARSIEAGAVIVRDLEDTDHGLQYSALDLEQQLWTFGTYAPGGPSV